MTLYCGIDLHSNNHVVVVIDEQDRRLLEKRLPNDLEATVRLLAPYADDLYGIAVESTFNWYWLVDGLMAHGYAVSLVNTPAADGADRALCRSRAISLVLPAGGQPAPE